MIVPYIPVDIHTPASRKLPNCHCKLLSRNVSLHRAAGWYSVGIHPSIWVGWSEHSGVEGAVASRVCSLEVDCAIPSTCRGRNRAGQAARCSDGSAGKCSGARHVWQRKWESRWWFIWWRRLWTAEGEAGTCARQIVDNTWFPWQGSAGGRISETWLLSFIRGNTRGSSLVPGPADRLFIKKRMKAKFPSGVYALPGCAISQELGETLRNVTCKVFLNPKSCFFRIKRIFWTD